MKLHFKSASFSTDNGRTSWLSSFYGIYSHKTSSQNISFTLLQISLKLHEHRGGFWRKSSNFGDFDPEKPHRATLSGFIHGMVVVLRVRRRLRVVWSAMDTLAALQPSLESQSLEQVGYWNSVLGFQQRMFWGVLHRLPWIFGFITNLEINWCSLVSSTFPFAPLTTHLKPYCLISRLPINFHKWE